MALSKYGVENGGIEVRYWQEKSREASKEDRIVVYRKTLDSPRADPSIRAQTPAAHLSGSFSKVQSGDLLSGYVFSAAKVSSISGRTV